MSRDDESCSDVFCSSGSLITCGTRKHHSSVSIQAAAGRGTTAEKKEGESEEDAISGSGQKLRMANVEKTYSQTTDLCKQMEPHWKFGPKKLLATVIHN